MSTRHQQSKLILLTSENFISQAIYWMRNDISLTPKSPTEKHTTLFLFFARFGRRSTAIVYRWCLSTSVLGTVCPSNIAEHQFDSIATQCDNRKYINSVRVNTQQIVYIKLCLVFAHVHYLAVAVAVVVVVMVVGWERAHSIRLRVCIWETCFSFLSAARALRWVSESSH